MQARREGGEVKRLGLMPYGPSFLDLFRRAADKILRGTKLGDAGNCALRAAFSVETGRAGS